jgi:hypothetical protein
MAIRFNKADVIAYLRSIGAPESPLTLSTLKLFT